MGLRNLLARLLRLDVNQDGAQAADPRAFVAETPLRWTSIHDLDGLPKVHEMLTAPKGALQVSKLDRRSVAVASMFDGSAIIVATDRSAPEVRILLTRARHANFKVIAGYEVEQDLLAVLYEESGETGHRRHQRTATDAEIDAMFTDAINRGASDIHLHGGTTSADVEYRIHGAKVKVNTVSRQKQEMLSRAMYLADGGSAQDENWSGERYLNHTFFRTIAGQDLRCRFSQRPGREGSFDTSLRLFHIEQKIGQNTFADLGYTEAQITTMEHILNAPDGLVLLIGRMGSGKSTTLKTALEYLDTRYEGRAKIQTLEDPIEYHIRGVRQSPISARSAGTDNKQRQWELAMGAMLRSDCQILMLGEILDAYAARFGQQWAASGHMMLSTLHARTGFDAIERLLLFGLERELVTADGFIRGIARQALVQFLCPECSIPWRKAKGGLPRRFVDALETHAESPSDMDKVHVRGPGCPHCDGVGAKGRQAMVEFLVPDDSINSLLLQGRRRDAENLWRSGKAGHVLEGGTPTLIESALKHVFAGRACPLDVDRYIENIVPSLPADTSTVRALREGTA